MRRAAVHAVEALERRQLLTSYTLANLSSTAPAWNVNSNWSPSGYPNATAAVANLNVATTVNETISLGTNITVGSLTIGSSNSSHSETISDASNTLTFNNGSSQATLTVASAGVVNLNCAIKLGNNTTITVPAGDGLTINGNIDTQGHILTVDSAGSVTINGVISGAGALVDEGTGSLTLGGVNTYTGTTTVTDSTLKLTGGSISNSTSVSLTGASGNPAVLIGSGSITPAVTFNAYSQIGSTGFTVSSGWLTLGAGSTVLLVGAITNGIALSSAGNASIANASGSPMTLSGPINLGTRVLTINESSNLTLAGAISSSSSTGGIVDSGGGVLTLSGSNTYTGTTTVTYSTLSLASGSISSGAVSLTGNNINPAILGGTGSIAGTVTFNAYSQIAASGLTLSGSSTLTLGAGSTVLLAGPITGNIALSSGNASLTPFANANATLGGGTINTNGRTLTLGGTSGYINVNSVISGSGNVAVTGPCITDLYAVNTYTGSTTFGANSILGLGANAAINSTATITISSGCQMWLGNSTISGAIIVDGGTLSGPGTIGALTVKNSGQAYFTGTVNGALNVLSSGHAELSGTVTGAVNVSTAAFLGFNTSALTATANTTTTGTITANNSYFSPNGTVNCSGLILTNNSVFECEIDSSTAGRGYPQVNVTSGAVSLGTTSSLVVSGSRTSNVTDSPLSLINNVSGTFVNQAAGSYVSSNRVRYSVSYLGGSGHAFTLTDSTPVVAVGDTYTLYEDASYSGNVLGNDTGSGLSVYSINGRTDYVNNPNLHTTDASGNITGTLYLQTNGNFTYTPTTNYNSTGYGFVGLDQLTIYTNTDGTYTSNSASLKFNVVDPPPPTPPVETIHTVAGTALSSALFAEFSQAAANSYSATIIWGDGSANGTGTISADSGGSYQWKVTGSHTYSTPGAYTAWVTIQDNFGMTFSAQTTIDVAPTAPTALTATPGDGQVALNWSAVTGATGYNVYGSTDGSTFTNPKGTNPKGSKVKYSDKSSNCSGWEKSGDGGKSKSTHTFDRARLALADRVLVGLC